MQFDIYRTELPNLGETHIIFAWSGTVPQPDWGSKVDTVSAPTGRDAADIYFRQAKLVFPWGGMRTMATGVYWVAIKH